MIENIHATLVQDLSPQSTNEVIQKALHKKGYIKILCMQISLCPCFLLQNRSMDFNVESNEDVVHSGTWGAFGHIRDFQEKSLCLMTCGARSLVAIVQKNSIRLKQRSIYWRDALLCLAGRRVSSDLLLCVS